ncbi:unnamed protein product [Closterium sp. Naga37s-1]|nr:unnamed protein product [Closterium sp. Naga37s-1]
MQSSAPEARVIAVNPSTIDLLKRVGVWDDIASDTVRAAPFQHMQVWDFAGPGFIRFNASASHLPYLGYIVENKLIVSSLLRRIQTRLPVPLLPLSSLICISFPVSSPPALFALIFAPRPLRSRICIPLLYHSTPPPPLSRLRHLFYVIIPSPLSLSHLHCLFCIITLPPDPFPRSPLSLHPRFFRPSTPASSVPPPPLLPSLHPRFFRPSTPLLPFRSELMVLDHVSVPSHTSAPSDGRTTSEE